MSVMTLGALPARKTISLGKRTAAAPVAARTATVRAPLARPLVSSNTGLPGALAPAAPSTGSSFMKPRPPVSAPAQVSSPAPAPSILQSRPAAPAPAPAPAPGGAVTASDYGWYQDGGSSGGGGGGGYSGGGGGGGGMLEPASDVRPIVDPADGAPKDGIPTWAAVGGIALVAIVGVVLLHRQGIV